MTRKLNPYELNQLRKYGLSDIDLSSLGEIPVEYLTGHCEFSGSDFKVSKDTLIPRIETEEILGLTQDFLISHPTPVTIVDVGTGSGCIGISLAKQSLSLGHPDFSLFLVDVSPPALEIARENSLRLLPDYQSQIHLLDSYLLHSFPSDKKIDLLTANLPYIPSSAISTLDSSVRDFEPHLALDGGKGGAILINRLLKQLPLFCSKNFLAIFEIDDTHDLSNFDIPKIFTRKLHNDNFHRARFLTLTYKVS